MTTYSYSGAPQIVTISQSGTYVITALGAQGGNATADNTYPGGLGARQTGSFDLQAGDTLKIVVGQQGSFSGGGGGSFVFVKVGGSYVPLIVAGGGGGPYFGNATGAGGTRVTTTGTSTASGYGGGGAAGVAGSQGGTGGGGAGVNGDGTTSTAMYSGVSNGGAGGKSSPTFAGGAGYNNGNGGFGGGGGIGAYSGGGGGGYTGGAGGDTSGSGKGGTSFVSTLRNGSVVTAQSSDAANSGNGSVTISEVCFVTGTRIRTERGEVAVEHLAVGDRALTASGEARAIRWIGHRLTDCDAHPEPRKAWPVRVAAGTFGAGLPYADLWLSPAHALCLDGSLVPVRGLIDGDRIAQVERAEVTYWHVELDDHDVLLANGLPAESYLDTGNRVGFDNAGSSLLPFDEDPAPGYDGAGHCLPLVESGPRLSALRARFGLGRPVDGAAVAVASAVHLVADGAVLAPCLASANELRFLVPAGVADLRLVSPSFSAGGGDVRRLGVIIGALALSDGSGWQEVPLDAPALYAGFHALEGNADGAWRWTDGAGHLAPALLPAPAGPVLLRLRGVFAGLGPSAAAGDDTRLAA